MLAQQRGTQSTSICRTAHTPHEPCGITVKSAKSAEHRMIRKCRPQRRRAGAQLLEYWMTGVVTG